jgi:diguanylate cyclase (GGDEF)-like protein
MREHAPMSDGLKTAQPLPSGSDLPIPWHLRLPRPLEGDFIRYLLQFSRSIILSSVTVVLLLYATALLVESSISIALLEQNWRLHLLSFIPVAAVWWLAYTDEHPLFLQPAIAITALTIAATHNYAAFSTDHPLAYIYYMTCILPILLMATIFRISLYWALSVSLTILIMLAAFLSVDHNVSASVGVSVMFLVAASTLLSLVGHYFFERLQRQHFLAERVLAMHRNELHSANKALASEASEDALTGAVNRRGMAIRLGSLIHHARQNQQLEQLYVILFDIDFFKQFNDTYGHLAGDDCLKQITNVPISMIRSDKDFVARYGGEEFVVVLSGIQQNDALIFAERLRARIEQLGIEHRGSRANNVVTISIGITGLVAGITRSEEIIKRADEALYEAKGAGRNKTIYQNDDGSFKHI